MSLPRSAGWGIVLHGAVPLLAGGLLYVGWRSESLRLFDWVQAMGAAPLVAGFRATVAGFALPGWVVYSLPNGLWLYAFVAVAWRLWGGVDRRSAVWILFGPGFAVLTELGQLSGIVPGTYDPLDWLLAAAAAGAGFVLSPRRDQPPTPPARGHAPSLLFAAVMLVFAAGSKQDPKAKAKIENEEKTARAELDTYFKTLAKAYQSVAQLAKTDPKDEPCDGERLRREAQAKAEQTLDMIPVHGPFLERFGLDKVAFKKDQSAWAWLTDRTFRGHFAQHPSDASSYSMRQTAKVVRETFLPARYLLVLWAREGKAVMPVWHGENAKDQYDSGRFDGWAVVVDQTDGSVECHFAFLVENSPAAFQGGYTKEEAEQELRMDLAENLEQTLRDALPKGVSLSEKYRSVFN